MSSKINFKFVTFFTVMCMVFSLMAVQKENTVLAADLERSLIGITDTLELGKEYSSEILLDYNVKKIEKVKSSLKETPNTSESDDVYKYLIVEVTDTYVADDGEGDIITTVNCVYSFRYNVLTEEAKCLGVLHNPSYSKDNYDISIFSRASNILRNIGCGYGVIELKSGRKNIDSYRHIVLLNSKGEIFYGHELI